MFKIKKCMKIIFWVIIFIFLSGQISVYATTAGDNLINDISTGTNTFMSMGENKLNNMGITIDISLVKGIAQVLYFAGCVIVIALTMYKAVKYGMSSAGEKASAKRELAGWIIICLIIIGAYPLFRLIASAFGGGTLMSDMLNQLNGVSNGISSASQNSTFMLILNTIFRVIQVAAIGYIIIRFTVVGIKYFTTSAASEKAQGKGELIRTLILAIIIFGAAGFFEIIYRAINS